ncbi:MAG: nucleoside-diphosphate kinase [bacterium]
MEQCLILVKPDGLQRGLVGEIISRFERAGLKIIGSKMVKPDKELLHKHYEEIGTMISRNGQDKYDFILNFMQRGPVLAFVLEGIEAVVVARKIVGATEPKSALPGTIRGDYAHMSYAHGDEHEVGIPNLVHCSGDPKEAELEVALWFSQSELFDYPVAHETFTQPKK